MMHANLPEIPPMSTEESQRISELLANSTFEHMEKLVDRRELMLMRDQFFEHHDFFWELADTVAQVAVGQWHWLGNTAFRHWEPAHHWLGYQR